MAAFYSCLRGQNRDCTMASGPAAASGATEPSDTAEECPGKKKSRFQTFKNLFAKKKRKEATAAADDSGWKCSQSNHDVNTPEPIPVLSDKDSDSGSNIKLGNKALSHDSVFTSDSPSSETPEALGASQDSIHGKVKSLQLQLQQTIRLGSPSIPGRKAEEWAALSEDDGLPCSPPEDSSFNSGLTTSSQRSSGVVQRTGSLSLEESDSDDDQISSGAPSRPSTPQVTILVDFSHPANSLSCLDSSAARHRIAVNTKACAKRKPASREMLQSRKRDLRERVLLRDAQDRLRAARAFTEGEENQEDTEELEETLDESHLVCSVLEQSEEEPQTSTQIQTSSRTSAASAESSDEEECVPHEDHDPSMEFSGSSWENPITLELQTDDFLLDAGCEVVSEEQGSLLEEVLSSLKGPLTSGLVREPKDVDEQMEVEDAIGEDVPYTLAENTTTNLLDFTDPASTLEEQIIPVQYTLSESAEHFGEVEDTSEKEHELVEKEYLEKAPLEDLPEELPEGESEDEEEQVPDEREDIDVDMCEDHRIMKEVDDVNDEEAEEENIEENRIKEAGSENKADDENEVEKEEEVAVEDSAEDAEEPKEVETEQGEESRISETCPPEKEDLEITVYKASAEIESFHESDQCAKVETLVPLEVVSQSVDLPAIPAQECVEPPSFVVTTSVDLSFFNRASDIPKQSKEREDKTETLQEEATEYNVVLKGLQDQSSGSPQLADEQQLARPGTQKPSTMDSRPRFTVTPAWQKLLSGGAVKELSQPVELSVAEGESAFTESMSCDQPLDGVKAERPTSPVRSRSAPSLPLPRETVQAHEETTPENPFGVRLRKTAILHRYASEGESPTHSTQPDSAETQKTALEQLARKPALPKKPDQVVEGAVKPRRSSDLVVGRTSLETSEPPSWISVARQKQKLFKENSLEEPSESKVPTDEEFNKKGSLPDLSSPVTKDIASLLKPVASPVKVACSLEISKPSMAEKEGKRMAGHLPPAPLGQEEPPWLALAKKKAKAWSEMPQIVQ